MSNNYITAASVTTSSLSATNVGVGGNMTAVNVTVTGNLVGGNITLPGVQTLNTLTGDLTLSAGSNIAVATVGSNIVITGLTGPSTGVTSLNQLSGALTLSAGSNIAVSTVGSNIVITGLTGPSTGVSTISAANTTLNGVVGLVAGTDISITVCGAGFSIASTGASQWALNPAVSNIDLSGYSILSSGSDITLGDNTVVEGNLSVNGVLSASLGLTTTQFLNVVSNANIGNAEDSEDWVLNVSGSVHIATADVSSLIVTLSTNGTITSPSGYSSVQIELWGGGGIDGINDNGLAGGGGYTTGIYSFTGIPTFNISVGTAGGGGAGAGNGAGNGGGATYVIFGTSMLAIAGGGGGAGGFTSQQTIYNGGAGGGATAGDGVTLQTGGKGGNGITGGAGGGINNVGQPGTSTTGTTIGNGGAALDSYSGGGGAGYGGGGAGGASFDIEAFCGGGGGGSSYVDPALTSTSLLQAKPGGLAGSVCDLSPGAGDHNNNGFTVFTFFATQNTYSALDVSGGINCDILTLSGVELTVSGTSFDFSGAGINQLTVGGVPVSGGGGNTAQWATFVAVAPVNLNGNVLSDETSGIVSISGKLNVSSFELTLSEFPVVVWDPSTGDTYSSTTVGASNWANYSAVSNIDLSGYSIVTTGPAITLGDNTIIQGNLDVYGALTASLGNVITNYLNVASNTNIGNAEENQDWILSVSGTVHIAALSTSSVVVALSADGAVIAPSGYSYIQIELWGGGGVDEGSTFAGGAGYTSGVYLFTGTPTFNISVGDAGGGGAGAGGGAGGGASYVTLNTSILAIAGGGGGAGRNGVGGSGGGANAGDGQPAVAGGKGGTSTAGGAGGGTGVGTTGSPGTFTAGTTIGAGGNAVGAPGFLTGGGGSGYGGGGGGGVNIANATTGGGGGGSSYVDPALTSTSLLQAKPGGLAGNACDVSTGAGDHNNKGFAVLTFLTTQNTFTALDVSGGINCDVLTVSDVKLSVCGTSFDFSGAGINQLTVGGIPVGGGGNASQWATFAAVSNVNMSGNAISNCSNIHATTSIRIDGSGSATPANVAVNICGGVVCAYDPATTTSNNGAVQLVNGGTGGIYGGRIYTDSGTDGMTVVGNNWNTGGGPAILNLLGSSVNLGLTTQLANVSVNGYPLSSAPIVQDLNSVTTTYAFASNGFCEYTLVGGGGGGGGGGAFATGYPGGGGGSSGVVKKGSFFVTPTSTVTLTAGAAGTGGTAPSGGGAGGITVLFLNTGFTDFAPGGGGGNYPANLNGGGGGGSGTPAGGSDQQGGSGSSNCLVSAGGGGGHSTVGSYGGGGGGTSSNGIIPLGGNNNGAGVGYFAGQPQGVGGGPVGGAAGGGSEGWGGGGGGIFVTAASAGGKGGDGNGAGGSSAGSNGVDGGGGGGGGHDTNGGNGGAGAARLTIHYLY